MDLTVQNVYGLLIRSRLLPLEDAKALYERWLSEGKDDLGNVERFTRWLVDNRYVTEYQATLLARGHADYFFLDQYKILDRVGRGRMAGVYKAVHSLGQVVAIKVLPPSRAKDPLILARFQREARLALRLKHPNIVRAFQMGEAHGLHYLVMEYLEGETLEEVLQRRRQLPPVEAVRVIHQALLGLQHLHEQGMVHRDLKPSNMMLVPARKPGQPDTTADATLKILDIGLGRPLYDETVSAKASDQLTSEGALLGTPDYMSPEQARDARTIDIRADIYSLGCVLYHCLVGQTPFPDTNIINLMIRHASEAPRPLRSFDAAFPEMLEQVVGWMMAKDPNQRYPTPERAAQALRIFLHSESAEARPPEIEQLRTPESEPDMQPYLSWLEDHSLPDAGATPTPTPVTALSAPAGAATLELATTKTAPSVSVKAATPPAPPPERPAATTRVVKALRDKPAPAARTMPMPTTRIEDGSDVELIMPHVLKKFRWFEGQELALTRRDLVMFGTGVGVTLLAVSLGWLLSKVFGRGRTPVRPPEDDGDPEK